MSRLLALLLLATMAFAAPAFANPRALFDNAHAEDAGNADWVIDDDFPIPVPAQSGITAGSPLTYWTGGISSFGVSLVKRGYTVHTNITTITYGNLGNPYDLANYDVFIVPEPNTLFSAAEKTAILNFVRDGGGLIAIGDHGLSDRNNDCFDSPMIWNDLDPTNLLGVHFQVGSVCGSVAEPNNSIYSAPTISTNVAPSATDSITHGPVGVVTGLQFANGTSLTLYPASNPTVRGEVWMNGTSQTSTTLVMAASSQYGSGRVFFIGDSSPVDDGSARAGNTSIYDGWGVAGATDSTLFVNATLWATRRGGPPNDTQAPVVTITSPVGGEVWKSNSPHAITWTATDNVGVTGVDLALSVDGGASYPTSIATNLANTGTYAWNIPNVPGTQTRVLVTAHDAASFAAYSASPANFTIDRWVITSSAGPGGTISPLGAAQQPQNTSRTYTITPAVGYHVADVLVDAVSVGAVASYAFTAISANHTIAASFAADGFAVVDSTVVGNGSVTRSPNQATYAQGTSVLVTALPGTGFAFTGWGGDTTGTANPFTVTVTRALSYTAAFADTALPVVTVLSPIGNESWTSGTTQAITWAAADNAGVTSVTLNYSTTGNTGPWLTIASGQPNTGTYAWTLPAPATTQAVVRVTALDAAGNQAADSSGAVFTILDPSAGVGSGPAQLSLARPTPNPSSNLSTIAFSLPREMHARLQVLDPSGRRVAALEGSLGAGHHVWSWDGRLASGSRARAGLYFVRLSTPDGDRLQRLVRLD